MIDGETSLLSPSESSTCTANCIRIRFRGDGALRQIKKWISNATTGAKKSRSEVGYQVLESAAESKSLEARRRKQRDKSGQFPSVASTESSQQPPRNCHPRSSAEEDTSSDSDTDELPIVDDFAGCNDGTKNRDREQGQEFEHESDTTRNGHHLDGDSRPVRNESSSTLLVTAPEPETNLCNTPRRRPSPRMNLALRSNWDFADQEEVIEWQNEYNRLKLYRHFIGAQTQTVRSLRRNSRQLDIPLRRNYVAYHVSTRGMIMFSIIHEEEGSAESHSGDGQENACKFSSEVKPRNQRRLFQC